MKRCYLDSNVLVYFKDDNSLHHQTAVDLVDSLIPEKYEIYLSSLILDEFLHSLMFVLRQKRININDQYKRLNAAIRSILDLQHVHIANPSPNKDSNLNVIKIMQDFHLGPRDAYHFLIIQENNIGEFATFDNDFKRVFAKKLLKQVK